MNVSSRNKLIIVGGLIGAAIGAIAAWAYSQNQDDKRLDSQHKAGALRLKAGAPEYVKIGMAVLALVRQVAELFKPV
ncbi:MAG: hypothetical protein AUK03_09375 [Anaerolineae bacterium CG2_30_64_16]|nr:MAG: hypothetical protein AUK03_09375 [Anaerolineae bacterium CG2_30_64_16]